MSTLGESALGLRERKKLRTRETIARTALDLFARHGFAQTTIRTIAEAADVAPRTVSGYFPAKEDLVFPHTDDIFDGLAARLELREPGETAVDALRAWLVGFVEHPAMADVEESTRRRRVIESDADLRIHERGLQERGERIVAAAVAVDLDLPADDLLPHMVGAATLAALDALGRRMPDAGDERFRDWSLAVIDQTMAFVGAGVGALAERERR